MNKSGDYISFGVLITCALYFCHTIIGRKRLGTFPSVSWFLGLWSCPHLRPLFVLFFFVCFLSATLVCFLFCFFLFFFFGWRVVVLWFSPYYLRCASNSICCYGHVVCF